MRKAFIAALAAGSMLASLPAQADEFLGAFVINVPVSIDGLNPAIKDVRIDCSVQANGGGVVSGTNRVIAQGYSSIPLENGGYRGHVRIKMLPQGYPAGVDPIPDARNVGCSMTAFFTCSSGSGGSGRCQAHQLTVDEASPARSLFTRREGAPFVRTFSSSIDPATAERLPRRF